MPNKIERLSGHVGPVALTDSEATSEAIPFGASAGGLVFVSALATGTKIVWHAASTAGDFYPIVESGNAVETYIQQGKAYPVPDACFSARFIKLVLDDGTATITMSLKG
jgi:hypothetical protein